MSTSWKLAALCGLLVCFSSAPAFAQPANDNCVDAVSLTENVAASFTTLDATNEGALACRGLADVWFEWTATLDGSVTVALSNLSAAAGTSTDTNHSVYINPGAGLCPTDADEVDCSDPITGSFTAVNGTSYLIRVGMWSTTTTSRAQGDLTVLTPQAEICDDGVDNDFDGDTDCADTADCATAMNCQPPVNDNCAGAISISENTVTAFNSANATNEGALACRGTNDIWFEITPSADGQLTVALSNLLATDGVGTDTNHSLYLNPGAGLCPTDADEVVCSDPSSFDTAVTAGQSYLIRIGAWSTSSTADTWTGDMTVDLLVASPEVCDDGVDNDADGDTDCADSECVAEANCLEAGNCDDGIDNDLDGDTDCADVADCGAELFCQAAANDDCLNAEAIGEGTFPFDTTNSILDGPNDADGNMDNDVWFLYTATVSGTATIDTCAGPAGTLTDTVIIVYDGAAGCPIAGDLGLANDDDTCAAGGSGSAFASQVDLPVAAGDQLLIQVGGWNGAEGDALLTVAVNPPANDNCLDAIAVGEGTIEFNNLGATLDGPTDGDSNMGADVWFLYTAGGDGTAVINTCATEATLDDTVIIVYDGAMCPVAGDTGLANDDDTCAPGGVGSAFNSEVNLPVTAGSTYLIQVGGWTSGGAAVEGIASLSISLPEVCDDGVDNDADGDTDCADADCVAEAPCLEAGNCADGIDNDNDGLTDCLDTVDCAADVLCDGLPPANDNCLDAVAVGEGVLAFENLDATLDGPTDADGNMDADVWFLYTATVTGTATIDTCAGPAGSLTDTVIIVYDGAVCPIAGDLGLANDDDTCAAGGSGSAFASQVELAVTAGSSYLVQVGGWNGATGTANLSIDVVIPGDDCLDPFMVGEGSHPFTNEGATFVGPDAADDNMDTDVWFLYTPTLSGDATIETCLGGGTLDDTVIIVYDAATGCPVAGDLGLATDDDSCANTAGGSEFMSSVTLPVTLGESYYVQVGGWNGATGDGTLVIDTVLPCVDPTPSFSAGPALSGIAPLAVDFMNTSDNGGDAATTYDWAFGDGGTSTDESPSYTYTGCGTYDVTLTANGCGVSVPTTQAALITVYAMGDTNGDCNVDVADAIATANYLFAGGPAPVCGNASDVNGDGTVDIADAVYMLIFLFGGGSAPVAPAGSGC